MMEQNEQRIVYADILRIAAIMAVIIIHSGAPLINQFNSIRLSWWWFGNLVESATRWAVPIFIMVSGMLLLNPKKDEPIKEFLSKRFMRVLIPFIFWGIVYTIWTYRRSIIEYQPLPVLKIIESFYTGTVYVHLWFVYTILGLYLLTPIIRIYVKNSDLNNLKYFLFMWFIANGVFSFIQKISNIKIGVDFSFFWGFIGYYILGYYLHTVNLNKKQINYIYFFSIVGLMTTVIGTFIINKNNNGVVNQIFYDNLTPNVILMSSGVFIFIKNYNWNVILESRNFILNKINNHSIKEFSSFSFGIYLIHILILNLLSSKLMPIKINAMLINPAIGILLTSILTLLISYYILKFLKRYSLSRYIM